MLTSRILSRFRRTPFFDSHSEDMLLAGFVSVATEYNVLLKMEDDLKTILYFIGAAQKRKSDRDQAKLNSSK